MEDKGYLRPDGSVTSLAGGPDSIGKVGYKETRYNLRRTYVVKEWVVILKMQGNSHETRFTAPTRKEAIAYALCAYHGIEQRWCLDHKVHCGDPDHVPDPGCLSRASTPDEDLVVVRMHAEIDEAISDPDNWDPEALQELETDLAELERTDPAVGRAAKKLDETIREVGRG